VVYKGINELLNQSWTLGCPAEKIAAAANALRAHDGMLATSQLRFAEVSTTIRNLKNRPIIVKAFQEITGRKL